MSNPVVSRSTAGLPARQRAQYWADALTELCGHLHADPFGASSLEGHIDYATLWRLKLCQIEVSRHRISLPQSCAGPGEHPVIKIMFQTHGTAIFRQDDRRIELTPGDCLAYDVSRPHEISSLTLTKHEVAIIPKALLRRRGYALAGMSAQKLSARSGAARAAHDVLRAAFREAATLSGPSAIGIADALLHRLLLTFAEEGIAGFDPAGPDALRVRAKSFIDEHLCDPELTIDKIAAFLGCTKRYLHMLFSEDGTTISRYIWQARLENSRRALLEDARSITDIAFSWGFSSSSHFSRLFRTHFGVPPSALRPRRAPAKRGSPG